MSFSRPLYVNTQSVRIGPTGCTGPTGDSYWQIASPSGIYYNGGNVSIGKTTTSSYTLDISGNLATSQDASINSVIIGRGSGNVSTNTALGYQSLQSNTTGEYNTAIGYQSLQNNIDGYFNTALGYQSLQANTTGDYNTAIGMYSLLNNTYGQYNTALGKKSLQSNTTGSYNTSLGYQSLQENTTGDYNVALGNRSLLSNINGTNNTAIGNESDVLSSSTTYNNSTAIGYQAIIDASNQIVFGTSSEKIKIPGTYVGIGGVYNLTAGYALDVNGNLNVSGTTSNVSDYRIKENVTNLNETFSVDKLRPVTYFNKITDKQDTGLIADELQEIYSFLVNGEKDGLYFQSVNYIGLIPILIKEIQELKKKMILTDEYINELKKSLNK
jgi:hypothetical protein